jgi:hypothetical protein
MWASYTRTTRGLEGTLSTVNSDKPFTTYGLPVRKTPPVLGQTLYRFVQSANIVGFPRPTARTRSRRGHLWASRSIMISGCILEFTPNPLAPFSFQGLVSRRSERLHSSTTNGSDGLLLGRRERLKLLD